MIKVDKDSKNEIPNTWSKIPLYELRNKKDRYAFTGGPFGSDLKSEHYTLDGIKILQLQNIGEGKFIDKGITYTSEEKANELISCNIYPGEIILAKMAPVARCCKVPFIDERYVMCSDGIRLSVDTDKFDNEFVFQALNSKYFRDEAQSKSTGTTRARIGLNELKQIGLYVPNSLSEQRKIAEILKTVDDKIDLIDQQIKETQELKKGLMQRLLTKGIKHIEFKDSPLGRIPKNWRVGNVETFIQNKKGAMKIGPFGSALKKDTMVPKGIKIYGQENIFVRDMNFGDRYITHEHFESLKSCELFPGDFIISMMGTIGKCMVVPDGIEKGIMDSHLLRLQLNLDVMDTDFLKHLFRSPLVLNQVNNLAVGGIMAGLSSKIVKNINFILPNINEQKQFAKIFTCFDDKLDLLIEKKTYYQELKQGLMQQLLTGKIRVKV